MSAASHWIDGLSAPLLVSWQITRDCDLCCLHCCTESAPGKRMPGELSVDEALALSDDIVRNGVPYVMLCGGEPLVVPHFFALADALGRNGVQLKIETNGQQFDASVAARLRPLPIRSIQVSLDGDSEEVYQLQRPGGSLAKAHASCRAARAAGLPLEVTFAPTRLNIHEVGPVIERARSLGAFRFNTGKLMRIGTAARLWERLEPDPDQYQRFLGLLEQQARVEALMELCYVPFSLEEGLKGALAQPPAALLVLPDGRVKVAAALPHTCADLRRDTLSQAWDAYRRAWHNASVQSAMRHAIAEPSRHAEANRWQALRVAPV